MKRVYLAGALTPKGRPGLPKNPSLEYLTYVKDFLYAQKIIEADNEVAVFNPALDILPILFSYSLLPSDEDFLRKRSLSWLEVCDALVLIHHLSIIASSEGVRQELNIALSKKIPVYKNIYDFIKNRPLTKKQLLELLKQMDEENEDFE